MRSLRLRFSVAVLALSGLAMGCSTSPITTPVDQTGDPVVATYAGETLTLDEFEKRYALATGGPEDAADDSLAAYEDFLSRYVDFRLKVQQARDLGLDQDPAILQEIDDYRAQLAKPYLLERTVLEEIVQDLYAKQQEEVRASHLLLLVDENADPADTLRAYQKLSAIRDSIVAGADFGAMAVRHSEDRSVAQNQGDLGYFSAGRMIQAFEDMAYSTSVGDLSPVFRTRFGYHIMKVTDRREATPEIQASHILVRVEPGATPADSAEALALIQSLQQRIAAGEDFGDLARQYSDDPGSGQKGGDLGFFARSRMVPEFGNAAYGLEEIGDVSDVVETQFGYHLIKLTGRKEPLTYDESYQSLKELAERLPRTAVRRQAVGRAFRDGAAGSLDSALVRKATAASHPDTLMRDAVLGRFGDYADSTFASIDDSTYTLGELADYIRTTRISLAADQQAQLFELADTFLNEQAVDLAALRLEETDPELRRIMQDYEDGVLLFRISEDSVWTAAAQDSVGLRAYFDANAGKYKYQERRRVVGFYSRNDSLLQIVTDGLDAGQTPTALQASLSDAGPSVRIDTVYVSEEAGTLFDEALALEVGQRTEILPYQSRQAVLYLDGIEAPRPMTFEEGRAQAVADYQDALDARLRARLRAKYDAELYPERLRLAFQGVPVTAPSESGTQ